MSRAPHPAVGDVWYRVQGSHIGDEIYEGAQLHWDEFKVIKVTPRGSWLQSSWTYKKPRFALADGCRWASRTKHEALERLIARKKRHLQILAGETRFAEDTLEVAREALKGSV